MTSQTVLWIALALSVTLSAAAQMFLKLGARHAATAANFMELAKIAVASGPIWVGLALYGLSMALWIHVLSKLDLSVAYPFVSFGFILTMCFGAFFLGENVTLARILGTVLVGLGCVLIVRSA